MPPVPFVPATVDPCGTLPSIYRLDAEPARFADRAATKSEQSDRRG
jgi:hypothetical protein